MSDYPITQLADDILRSASRKGYDEALQNALAYFDQLNAGIIEKTGIKLACCAGCSICCSLRVDVRAHEVFLIARHIRATFKPAELSELMVRLARHASKVIPLTPYEHVTQNIECPLLREGRCSVYSVRPHSCRRHHSQDLAACQYAFDNPTDLEFPAAHDRELFRTLTHAMELGSEVYRQLGFDDTIYELGTALAEALDSPSSWKRWRDHKKAFLTTSVTPAA